MKPTVIDPKTTPRAEAYALWMNAPNPMVTFFKTLDVTPLVRFSRKRGLKFNMLLCWCIGKAGPAGSRSFILSLLGTSCCTMTETVFDMHKSKKYGS